jgi:dihydroneopterin aldolase
LTDRLELRGLRAVASVGLLPEERERRQPVEVDLDVEVDTSEAGATDDLSLGVDYGAVVQAAAGALDAGHVDLLERLAALVVDAVMAVDDKIAAVEVCVRKLRPPVPHDLASAGVRIRRERGGAAG